MDEKAKAAAELVCKLIHAFNSKRDADTLRLLLAVLMSVQVSVPMTVSMENADVEKFLQAKVGDTVTTGGAIRMKPDMLKTASVSCSFLHLLRRRKPRKIIGELSHGSPWIL